MIYLGPERRTTRTADWPYNRWYCLYGDSEREMIEFVARLTPDRRAIQAGRTRPYMRITATERAAAIRWGATSIDDGQAYEAWLED